MPKKENGKIGKLIESDSIFDITANFVGGKIKEIDYDYEKDKEIVVAKELTLGIKFTLYIKEEALLGI